NMGNVSLPTYPASGSTPIMGINDDGYAVGSTEAYGPGVAVPTKWDNLTGYGILLGEQSIFATYITSQGNAINNNGDVAGFATDTVTHPVLWAQGSYQTTQVLGTLGGNNGAANAIISANAVVGWSETALTQHAFC